MLKSSLPIFLCVLRKILKEEKVEKNSKNFQKTIDKNIRGGGKLVLFKYVFLCKEK